MNSEAFRIGEVASRSGVSIDTVRYYERRKLLPPARRTEGGFRLFAPEAVERVRFIKQAQDLGLSLDEIGGLLASGNARECERVRDLLLTKLSELDEKMRLMRDFRRTLSGRLAACEQALKEQGKTARCPALVTIANVRKGARKSARKGKKQ